MSQNVLILKIDEPEPDSSYTLIRKTRRLKYYKKPNVDPNAMDIQQVEAAQQDALENWENMFLAINAIHGGKRKSKRVKRKTRKSRKN